MWKDPIVEEIHEIRRQLALDFGNDMQRIGAYFMERQKTACTALSQFAPRRVKEELEQFMRKSEQAH
jgi:phage gp16-like protein